jgi:hypothetical protein
VGEPPLGGVDEPPLGGFVPPGGAVLAEPLTVVPLESTDTDVEPTVASTWVLGAALTPVLVEATGVELELETDTCEGVVLTLDWVEAGGAETAVEAEAAGGAVLALVVTAALAAGVLTDTVALAEGVEETEAFTEAETLGAWGAPGRPSACAGRAKARHPRAQTAAQMAKRKPCLRGISSVVASPIT